MRNLSSYVSHIYTLTIDQLIKQFKQEQFSQSEQEPGDIHQDYFCLNLNGMTHGLHSAVFRDAGVYRRRLVMFSLNKVKTVLIYQDVRLLMGKFFIADVYVRICFLHGMVDKVEMRTTDCDMRCAYRTIESSRVERDTNVSLVPITTLEYKYYYYQKNLYKPISDLTLLNSGFSYTSYYLVDYEPDILTNMLFAIEIDYVKNSRNIIRTIQCRSSTKQKRIKFLHDVPFSVALVTYD